MGINQEIILRTKEANSLFQIKIGAKKSLMDVAMLKICSLYKLAKNNNNIYAYTYLFQIQGAIALGLPLLRKHIRKSRCFLKTKGHNLKLKSLPVLAKKQVTFSNPINFSLLRMVQKFDECISYITLAKNANAFMKPRQYYCIREEVWKQVFQALAKTIKIKSKNLPDINFQCYLNQEKPYLEAIKTLGAIESEILFYAIHSEDTPTLAPEVLHKIAVELRRLAGFPAK